MKNMDFKIVSQMFGDLDKMLGNWKNKCSEKLEEEKSTQVTL